MMLCNPMPPLPLWIRRQNRKKANCLCPEAKATAGWGIIIVSSQLSLLSTLLARCEFLRLTEAYRSKRAYGSFNEHQIPKPGASTGARLRCGHQARRITNFDQELTCQELNQSKLQVLAILTRPSGGCSNTLLKNWVVLLSLATLQQRALTQLLRHWFGLSQLTNSLEYSRRIQFWLSQAMKILEVYRLLTIILNSTVLLMLLSMREKN